MSRFVIVLSAVVLLFLTAGWIIAQDTPSGADRKLPLDLPSGGLGDDEDEEDAPEGITFYGSEYEGDGFFWCLDKSGSMSWGGRIDVLKQEMTEAISSLTRNAEFSAVAFSGNYVVWSEIPQKALGPQKGAAIAWVQTLVANGATCLKEAGIKTVQISNTCPKRRKQIIIVGDGVPDCYGVDTRTACLIEITAANWQRTPINTIYVSTDSAGIEFMQSMAQLNGGKFSRPE